MRSYNFYEIESVITLRIIYTLDIRSISFFNSAYAIKKMHHPMKFLLCLRVCLVGKVLVTISCRKAFLH